MNSFGLFVLSGALLLVYSLGSPRGGVRAMGGLLIFVLALGATALTGLMIWLGHSANWSSDGPLMLVVVIGLLVFGTAAFVLWGLLFAAFPDRESVPDRDREVQRQMALAIRQDLFERAPILKRVLARRNLLYAAIVFLVLGLFSVASKAMPGEFQHSDRYASLRPMTGDPGHTPD